MQAAAGFAAQQAANARPYVDDVFSAYTYTGNGATQTITNGIDLAGKGGLVWTKNRTSAQVALMHDSAHSTLAGNDGYYLVPSTTAAESYSASRPVFGGSGYFLNAPSSASLNANGDNYVSWTFRKAPKFFDVVTWTGDGGGSKTLNHSLGINPGMVIIKRTDVASNWIVAHRSGSFNLWLNSTNDYNSGLNQLDGFANPVNFTSTTFAVNGGGSGNTAVNTNGGTYVAYLFAHDTDPNGIIQCGSFTTDGSGNATVNLGWEPQYLIDKVVSTVGNWNLLDVMRGMAVSPGSDAVLRANLSDAEVGGNSIYNPTATGFYKEGGNANATFIYLAIRRPNKPPTLGTQVYNAIARTGTGVAATVTAGFQVDMFMCFDRGKTSVSDNQFADRLRGQGRMLGSNDTDAELNISASNYMGFDVSDGVKVSASDNPFFNNSTIPYINHFFRRAPGVFDIVCYTGTAVLGQTFSHNLGVVPEMMIVKCRSGGAYEWIVWHKNLSSASSYIVLNQAAVESTSNGAFNSTPPTSTLFTLGNNFSTNGGASYTYVNYLFATKAGISKVGSYIGNGTNQIINCGFTTGARFILIKRIDLGGNWFVWDTARGIVVGNDPHFSLDTIGIEGVSSDSVNPDNSGFRVNQNATTNINVTSATYIFLAIA